LIIYLVYFIRSPIGTPNASAILATVYSGQANDFISFLRRRLPEL